MDRRSIVFLTTPTSGTGSLWRLISILSRDRYVPIQIAGKFWEKGRMDDFRKWRPEPEGFVYMYNTPGVWPPSFSLDEVRWILNFRDPRDFVCNQYYWALQHPRPNETEEQTRAYMERVRSQGIEDFVLERTPRSSKLYVPFAQFLEQKYLDPRNVLRLSYCQLCLGFDEID